MTGSRPFEDKLKAYRVNRHLRKPSSPYQDMINDILSLLEQNNFDLNAQAPLQKLGEVPDLLDQLKKNPALQNHPQLVALLDQISTLPTLVEAFNKTANEKNFDQFNQATNKLASAAEKATEEASATLPSISDLQPILKDLGNFLKYSLSVLSASRSYYNATKKLDFKYWVQRSLVKHSLLQDALEALNKISSDTKFPAGEKNKTWKDLEEKIRGFLKLSPEELKKLNAQQYHEKLMTVFNLFSKNEANLTPEEKEFLASLPEVTSGNMDHILANLEKNHIEAKLLKIESEVSIRLFAKSETLKQQPEIKHMLLAYVEYDKRLNSNFKNAIDHVLNPNVELKEHNQLLKGDSIIKNEEIEKHLKEDAAEKKKDFIAKTLLLIATGCALGAAIATPIPGAQFVALGLGVAAAVLTVAALIVKPDVLKKTSAKDIWSFTSKIKTQYQNWKIQRARKQEFQARIEMHEPLKDVVKKIADIKKIAPTVSADSKVKIDTLESSRLALLEICNELEKQISNLKEVNGNAKLFGKNQVSPKLFLKKTIFILNNPQGKKHITEMPNFDSISDQLKGDDKKHLKANIEKFNRQAKIFNEHVQPELSQSAKP